MSTSTLAIQLISYKLKNCCAHVENVTKTYWFNDIAVEDEIDKIVINENSDVDISDYDDAYDDDTEDEGNVSMIGTQI